MPTETTGRYCYDCRRNVVATRDTPNHVLHLLITLFACGFWAPIWLILTMTAPAGWTCGRCGAICNQPRQARDERDEEGEEEDDRRRRPRRQARPRRGGRGDRDDFDFHRGSSQDW